jgi:hypothetical protein
MNPADHNETQDDGIGVGAGLSKVNEDSLQMRTDRTVNNSSTLILAVFN